VTNSELVKRRLPTVFAIVTTLRAIPQLAPVLIVAVLSTARPDDAFAAVASLAFVPVSILVGVARWWRHPYWVQGGELGVEDGLLFGWRTLCTRASQHARCCGHLEVRLRLRATNQTHAS
jgi:uncharacterized membrane protein YdbT with pleckstrin-like domain